MSHSPLHCLHSFLIVANEGSLVCTANRLVVSQPALPYQIRQLEQWLGVLLFECPGRELVLTRTDTSVCAWCHDALVGLGELRTALHSSGVEQVSLRLASGSSFRHYMLMSALPTPSPESGAPLLDDVRLELIFGSDEEVFSHVESGRADLGFVYTPCTSCLLEHHAVYAEELVLVCSIRILREHAISRTLADCVALSLVTYNESDAVCRLWFKVLFRRMPEATVSAHHVSDLEEVSTLVEAGMDWSVLSLHIVQEAVERGCLQVVRPIATRRRLNAVFAMCRTSSFPSKVQGRLLVRLMQFDVTVYVQPHGRNLPR